MGTLIDSATWGDVPYFEANAVLTGGPDCPDNIPIQALANRTAFLKKKIDDAVAGALTFEYANRLKTPRTIAMTGDGSWVVTFDGSGNVTAAMTLADTGVAAGTYPVVTVDSKGRVTGGRALQSADLPNNSSSLATNGYQKLPSGLIMQWGTYSGSSNSGTVTFPFAFPNAVYAGVATMQDQSSGAFPSTVFFRQSSSTLSQAVFYLSGQTNGAAYSFHWIAIGK